MSESINAQGDRGFLGVAADPLWSSWEGGWVYPLSTVNPVFGEPGEDGEEPTWGQVARRWSGADGSVDMASLEVIEERSFGFCTHGGGIPFDLLFSGEG
jgi:hypothetical protein